MNVDEKLFFTLYNFSKQNNRISNIMSFITVGSSFFFKILYGATLLYAFLRIRVMVLPLLTGPALSLLITKFLRLFSNRPRPFIKHRFISIVPHEDNSSFPSQHSCSAFAIALAVWHVSSLLGAVALMFAFITGLSRIMVGVHYPLDVILGAVMGALVTSITFILI